MPTGMSVRIIYKRDRYLRGGDHIPFLERRYPAARFTEVNEDYRHQHQDVRVENGEQFGDLVQFVDFGYAARVAKVNAATLAGLASAPAAPADARVHTGQLSNDTALSPRAWSSASSSASPRAGRGLSGLLEHAQELAGTMPGLADVDLVLSTEGERAEDVVARIRAARPDWLS